MSRGRRLEFYGQSATGAGSQTKGTVVGLGIAATYRHLADESHGLLIREVRVIQERNRLSDAGLVDWDVPEIQTGTWRHSQGTG